MTIVYAGRPVPFDGKRRLTGKEAAQRAKAMACLRSADGHCKGQLNVGVFFDGTGNNEAWTEDGYSKSQRARNKHSNVSRLFDAHLDDTKMGFVKIYVPGVGTPFKEIGDTWSWRTSNIGNGFALMGADRINWAIASIFKALHEYSTGQVTSAFTNLAKSLMVMEMSQENLLPGDREGQKRWRMLTAVEEYVAAVLRKPGNLQVTQMNISVFGFSRGAAQARAFVHWLNHIFDIDGDGFEIAGVPVRISFLGIFDTVAAVGVGDVTPVTFGHMAWGKDTQSIHSSVQECAHFIALHEQRGSFPLESATGSGNTGYPGMHSDVGGGYYPGEQGKSMPTKVNPSPHLSQIPLLDMHFAALKAGVPMRTIEQIHGEPNIAASFSVDPNLLKTYNSWLSTSGINGGTVKEFTQAHCRQYLRWRGMMHTTLGKNVAKQDFFKRANPGDQKDLEEADTDLGVMLQSWRERREANSTVAGRIWQTSKEALRHLTPVSMYFVDRQDPLSAHEENFFHIFFEGDLPPPASIALFTEYVHDSRAGFRILGNHEPLWLTGGYARFRNVFLQTPTDARLYSAANESLKQVKGIANSTVDYFQRLYSSALSNYNDVRLRIEQGAKKVQTKAEEARLAAIAKAEHFKSAAEKTANQVKNAAVETGHTLHDAAIHTRDDIENAAVKTGRQLRDGAVGTAHELKSDAVKAGHKLDAVAIKTGAEISQASTRAASAIRQRAIVANQKIHDAAVISGVKIRQITDSAGAEIIRLNKELIRGANEQARLYHEAQTKIVRQYIAAENEWKKQIRQRWENK